MSRPTTETVNLLPLLDVLLCTMGTLIVVLGVMNRLARFHPTKGNPGKLASIRAQQEELVHAREDLDLRIEQFTIARDKTLNDLDLRRRRLSGIENHSRQLEDRLRALIDSKKQLQSADGSNSQREALRSELTMLNARQTELQAQLQKARTGSADRKPAFAIIPFDGLYKTSRRPIYIECRANQVILQPEGIVFTRDDFLGPAGPANPLAAALRAAQEYWRQVPAPGVPNEPYPLLLVRPDGIIAYYLAREALSSWDAEFGYELVGADWKLDFPMQIEPRLKDMEIRAVAEARERLQWLAGVSPELFQKQSNKVQYRVSPIRGGVVRDGGPSLGNDPFANDPLGGFGRADTETNSALGNGVGGGRYPSVGGRGGLSPGTTSHGLPEAARGSGDAAGGRTSLGGPEIGAVGPRYAGSGQGDRYVGEGGTDRAGGSGQGDHPAGGTQGDRNARGGQGNPSHSSQQQLAGTRAGGRSAATSAAEYGGVDLPGGMGGESASPGSDASNALADSRTGSTSSGTGASSGVNESTAASGGQPGGSDSGQSSSTGAPSMSYTAQNPQSERQRAAARSIAENRGRNWALPNSSGASVPIRRPIRIECRSDRLVLMPDSRDAQPQVIPLSDRTDDAVDQLVAAVRTHTRSWGIAGRGMYWKPQLVLDVEPAAEARAQDLQTLLADSGLDVKRK